MEVTMTDSILTSVKKCINGIPECDETFDTDLILFINSKLSTLCQLGVGPDEGFRIADKTTTWDQYITDPRLEFVKDYIVTAVQMRFAPPESSYVLNAMKEQLQELTFRINVVAEQMREENG